MDELMTMEEAEAIFRKQYKDVLAKAEAKNDKENKENNIPPLTEYAKNMKKRADDAVNQNKFKIALNIMQTALQKDESVKNYNSFINRIGKVAEIK